MRTATAPLFATSVPASAAVPTAAADHQDNHDDDEKCLVSIMPLAMIVTRRARPGADLHTMNGP
jgi:hypothetical protein